MGIGAEIEAELESVLEQYADSWTEQDRLDGERCARRIVELKLQELAGKDVAQDLRAIEATAATIAQRAQLKGAAAVDRVVRSVLTKLVSAVLGAMG
jgi:hypothetical protein